MGLGLMQAWARDALKDATMWRVDPKAWDNGALFAFCPMPQQLRSGLYVLVTKEGTCCTGRYTGDTDKLESLQLKAAQHLQCADMDAAVHKAAQTFGLGFLPYLYADTHFYGGV